MLHSGKHRFCRKKVTVRLLVSVFSDELHRHLGFFVNIDLFILCCSDAISLEWGLCIRLCVYMCVCVSMCACFSILINAELTKFEKWRLDLSVAQLYNDC